MGRTRNWGERKNDGGRGGGGEKKLFSFPPLSPRRSPSSASHVRSPIRRQVHVSGQLLIQPVVFLGLQSPICCHDGVSVPCVVQPLLLTRLSIAREAYSDHGWSSRPSSLAATQDNGGPSQTSSVAFPQPGRRTWTAGIQSVIVSRLISAAGKHTRTTGRVQPSRSFARLPTASEVDPVPRWSSLSSSLVFPPPGGVLRTAGVPAVLVRSAARRQRSVSGPRVVHPFSLARLSAAREAYPDRGDLSGELHLPICRQRDVYAPFTIHQPFNRGNESTQTDD